MRCQLGKKPFETLIVIQPETSHEYDVLDPTLVITDIPSPEDIVLSKDEMKKTAVIIDDFEMSRLNKVQIANLSKLFRYLSSHNNISIFCGYQDFFSVPIIIRKCATHFLIWRTRNSDELTIISKRVGVSKEIMHEIFRREMKSRNAKVLKTTLAKEALVKVMKAEQKGAAILENIAYGVKTGNGSAMQVWTEIRNNQKDYKQEYLTQQSQPSTPRNQPQPSPATPVPALGANGRKYKKSKNKAQVHLKEIAQILQKYAN